MSIDILRIRSSVDDLVGVLGVLDGIKLPLKIDSQLNYTGRPFSGGHEHIVFVHPAV